jgi:hypothetical protein
MKQYLAKEKSGGGIIITAGAGDIDTLVAPLKSLIEKQVN